MSQLTKVTIIFILSILYILDQNPYGKDRHFKNEEPRYKIEFLIEVHLGTQ